jgi:membrane-associated phospholipid phosphatase
MRKAAFWVSLFVVIAFVIYGYVRLDPVVAIYFYKTKPLEGFFEIVTRLGESKWYFLAFGALFLIFRYFFRLKDVSNRFLYLFLGVAMSGLIVDILKFIFGRARPKLLLEEHIYGVKFFGLNSAYFSFPSGHSATVFAIAVGVLMLNRLYGAALLCVALLISFSRIAITAHYLSDVVAGAYVGIVTALFLKIQMDKRGIKF